jgi:hypothetical protein
MRFYRHLFILMLLVSCATESPDANATALSIKVDALPPAYVNEAYTATIRAVGGLTPYTYKLSKGNLPPGLSLQGGEIRGTPSEEGDYTFTISVSDGKLSSTFEEYNLSVTPPPPAEITLNVPLTEIQRTVTLRAEIKKARGLQGFRSLIKWDAERFKLVPDSIKRNNEAYLLFFDEAPGQLRVDIGMVGGTLTGDRRVFEFALEPITRSTLQLDITTEYLGENSQHHHATITEGTAPQEAQDPDTEQDGEE